MYRIYLKKEKEKKNNLLYPVNPVRKKKGNLLYPVNPVRKVFILLFE